MNCYHHINDFEFEGIEWGEGYLNTDGSESWYPAIHVYVERWLPIKGYEKLYEVSSFGRIKSLKRTVIRSNGRPCYFPEIIKKPGVDKLGYHGIGLANKKTYPARIHRLVAQAFIPNPENKPLVNHIDSNPSNNRMENLEWCTHQENTDHAKRFGRLDIKGEKSPVAKLTDDKVRQMRVLRESGWTIDAISAKFNIQRTAADYACKRITWKHVV